MKFAVISIKPEYVEAIIEGYKVYELRRRKLNLCRGDHLIIYETSPSKKVKAVAEIENIIDDNLTSLWETVSERCSLSFKSFSSYFEGCVNGYALKLKNIKTYKNPPTLDELRQYAPAYSPPQFFHYLDEKHPLFTFLTESIN